MEEAIEEVKTPKVRKITAAQMATMNIRRNRKPKQTASLFDTPLIDRNYWGNDPGTDIEMAMTRIEISRSLNKGEMLDIKNCPKAAHLGKEQIKELMQHQLHLMILIADENDCNIFTNINGDGIVMVEFNNETNQYEFVFAK